MALDLWSHQFCLACDKQVESDSAAYCSEACRLTELERTSTPNSQPSSPGMTPPSYPWTASRQRPSSGLFLAPAYDFTNAQPYGSTPPQQSMLGNYAMDSHHSRSSSSGRVLTPSSSYTSLCSMNSANSVTESSQLSDGAKKELRAYAVSFEHVRTQRRRSY